MERRDKKRRERWEDEYYSRNEYEETNTVLCINHEITYLVTKLSTCLKILFLGPLLWKANYKRCSTRTYDIHAPNLH